MNSICLFRTTSMGPSFIRCYFQCGLWFVFLYHNVEACEIQYLASNGKFVFFFCVTGKFDSVILINLIFIFYFFFCKMFFYINLFFTSLYRRCIVIIFLLFNLRLIITYHFLCMIVCFWLSTLKILEAYTICYSGFYRKKIVCTIIFFLKLCIELYKIKNKFIKATKSIDSHLILPFLMLLFCYIYFYISKILKNKFYKKNILVIF